MIEHSSPPPLEPMKSNGYVTLKLGQSSASPLTPRRHSFASTWWRS